MNTTTQVFQRLFEQMSCFGDFSKSNPLCSKHCALRLKCAIEQNQNLRMEMLEDLIASEALSIKIQ